MHVEISDKITCSQKSGFLLISGPCQIESLDHSLMIAESLQKTCIENKVPFVFKSSFDKANRTSIKATRGVGLEDGLKILQHVKAQLGCPVLTDVQNEQQCLAAAEVVDVLQIPALLCRQTDLLLAAAKTKRVINIKKGQFLSPWDIKHVVDKINAQDNNKVMICERGTAFGYNTLINDFRSIAIMHEQTSCPIIFDATHSVQEPGAQSNSSGGQRKFAPLLTRAALGVGVAGIFIETHQDPDNAPSDGPCMIRLSEMKKLIADSKRLDNLIKESQYS